jgi:2-polyprenyl-3-methyl-5-hydroxy-6-metoxy-1,4-benzoquinol methylase
MKETFRGAWGKIDQFDLNKVTDLIVTGRKPEDAKPDVWFYEWLKEDSEKPITILDFGCGMGRNTFGLATYFKKWTVTGYDSEAMIAKSKDYCQLHYNGVLPPNLKFETDWEKLRTQRFDKILCMIVLQHIFEADLARYVKDFKVMTKHLMVFGRRFNDDKARRSTWTVLEENGLVPDKFFAGHLRIPYTPDGDPNEHNMAYYYFEK